MHRPLGQAYSLATGSAQFHCNPVPSFINTGPLNVLLSFGQCQKEKNIGWPAFFSFVDE